MASFEDEPVGTFVEADEGASLTLPCQSITCDNDATHKRLAGIWGRPVTAYAYYCAEHAIGGDLALESRL